MIMCVSLLAAFPITALFGVISFSFLWSLHIFVHFLGDLSHSGLLYLVLFLAVHEVVRGRLVRRTLVLLVRGLRLFLICGRDCLTREGLFFIFVLIWLQVRSENVIGVFSCRD